MNDYLDAPVLTAEGWLDAMPALGPGGDFSLLSLPNRSRAALFLKEKLRDLQQVRPELFPVWAHYTHYIQRKPGWARAKDALLRIQEGANRLHAHLLVIVFPVEQQLRVGDRAALDDVENFAITHDIPVLDLYPSFRAHWREDLYIDYWKRTGVVDKLHLNARGHALAAAEIASAILQKPDFYLAVKSAALSAIPPKNKAAAAVSR
jgi:hypothetical protein